MMNSSSAWPGNPSRIRSDRSQNVLNHIQFEITTNWDCFLASTRKHSINPSNAHWTFSFLPRPSSAEHLQTQPIRTTRSSPSSIIQLCHRCQPRIGHSWSMYVFSNESSQTTHCALHIVVVQVNHIARPNIAHPIKILTVNQPVGNLIVKGANRFASNIIDTNITSMPSAHFKFHTNTIPTITN